MWRRPPMLGSTHPAFLRQLSPGLARVGARPSTDAFATALEQSLTEQQLADTDALATGPWSKRRRRAPGFECSTGHQRQCQHPGPAGALIGVRIRAQPANDGG